jgi:hypothetical protein
MAAELGAVVDTVVSLDLRALSVDQLQDQFASVAPQVQRLTGFGGAVLAELAARTGGALPTADGRTRPLPGWAAEASGDSASAAGRLQQTRLRCRAACRRSRRRCWTGRCRSTGRRS